MATAPPQQRFEIILCGGGASALRPASISAVCFLRFCQADSAQAAAQQQERNRGQTGESRKRNKNAAGQHQRLRLCRTIDSAKSAPSRASELARVTIRPPEIGDHQSRNHRDQAVADGQHGVGLQRALQIHAVLQNADQKAGEILMPVIRMLATASR